MSSWHDLPRQSELLSCCLREERLAHTYKNFPPASAGYCEGWMIGTKYRSGLYFIIKQVKLSVILDHKRSPVLQYRYSRQLWCSHSSLWFEQFFPTLTELLHSIYWVSPAPSQSGRPGESGRPPPGCCRTPPRPPSGPRPGLSTTGRAKENSGPLALSASGRHPGSQGPLSVTT